MAKKKFDWYNHHLKIKVIFDPLNIKLESHELLVVIGDIHEKEKLFFKLLDAIYKSNYASQYDIVLISVGDLFDKGDGLQAGCRIFLELQKIGAYVLGGNHEAKYVNWKSSAVPWQELEKLPLVLSFVYPNNNRFTVLHGGVTPNYSWEDLKFNQEVVYVRTIDEQGNYIPYAKQNIDGIIKYGPTKPNGVNWHGKYDGRFGYIISGHQAQKDGVAKFYPHSCNLDTGAYVSGVLTAGVFNYNGFQKLIQVS